MSVVFTYPPPPLDSVLAEIGRVVTAFKEPHTDELRDIRLASLIDTVGDLHRRAMELHRRQEREG